MSKRVNNKSGKKYRKVFPVKVVRSQGKTRLRFPGFGVRKHYSRFGDLVRVCAQGHLEPGSKKHMALPKKR